MKLKTLLPLFLVFAAFASSNPASHAQTTRIRVEYEANFEATGTGFAPLGVVFHDGSFSTFDSSTPLSQTAGLALLAEGGNPATFLAEAEIQNGSFDTGSTDGQIGGSNRPLSRSFEIDVAAGNSTLSFASMFLPSNDWFIADEGSTGIDVSALLNGSSVEQTIELNTIYDAGTELEDFTRGGGTGPDPFGLAPRLSDAEGGNPNDQSDSVAMVQRSENENLFGGFVNPNSVDITRFIGASTEVLGTIRLTVVSVPRTRILVEFDSNFDSTGTGFAPLGAVFHDGSFSSFDTSVQLAQADGLALLAEGGNPAAFLAEAEGQNSGYDTGSTDGQIGGSNRPLGRSFEIDVADGNSTLSFASMFLPSNDWFVADRSGAGVDVSGLLDGSSNELTIDLNTIYDAGTELEDFTRGGGTGTDPFGLAPRLSDAEGGNPNDQNDFVSMVQRSAANLFANFVNPNSVDISPFSGASSGSLGTIRLTVIPVPRTRILVEFDSNFGSTGTGFAPLGAVFHDGVFRTFDSSTPLAQTDGLALLAEGGNPATFLAEAEQQNRNYDTGSTDGQIGGSNRPLGRSFAINVADGNSTLSFASMFLPSNDWFVADVGSAGIDVGALLDGSSDELTIDLNTIYDAGTELEDFTRGGGTGTDPFGLAPRLSDANGGNPNDQNDVVTVVQRTAGVNLFEDFVNPNNVDITPFSGASSAVLGEIRLSVVLVGDVNLDGTVDFLDIAPFITLLSTGGFQQEADINEDGVVNFLDISPFVTVLNGD